MSKKVIIFGATAIVVIAIAIVVSKSAWTASGAAVPHIQSISPTSGQIGTVVTVQGTRFDSKNNTVLFGSGAIVNIPAQNGTLTFTVPAMLDPLCIYSRPSCKLPSQPTLPGSYSVSVMTKNGTSNAVTFTVF